MNKLRKRLQLQNKGGKQEASNGNGILFHAIMGCLTLCRNYVGRSVSSAGRSGRYGEIDYRRFAATLAEHGIIVYCPQNPYIGGEKYMGLQRIATSSARYSQSFLGNTSGRWTGCPSSHMWIPSGLVSTDCLMVALQPFVSRRYWISTPSRSAREISWTSFVNAASYDLPISYLYNIQHEIYEFNLANTFNYAEMANLMAPRPFMVERGHHDLVGVDEWVAYEYSRVRRHYTFLGIPDRTEIEYFNGPHTIHGVGSFRFLCRFLNWAEAKR